MNNIKIDSVVFCEDARAELGGKYTLLGVASPELMIQSLPAAVPIAIWISGTPEKQGPFEAELRAVDEKKNVLLGGKMGGNINGLGKMSIVMGPMQLQVDREGIITFEWNFGAKWKKIGDLKFILPKGIEKPISSPSA